MNHNEMLDNYQYMFGEIERLRLENIRLKCTLNLMENCFDVNNINKESFYISLMGVDKYVLIKKIRKIKYLYLIIALSVIINIILLT